MKTRIARSPMTALLSALLCCGPIGAATAQVYKWVDENGVTHYGERPPQNRKAQTVETKPMTAPGSSPARPPDWQEKNLEFQKRRIERAQQAEREQQEAQEKRKRCIVARDDLEYMQSARRLYDLNDKGERVYLDDAERSAAIERARRGVEKSCS